MDDTVRVEEERLAGGNATNGVVRIGDTVRKPWSPSTERVVAFMERVRSAGVDVPRHLGRDDEGRQVLELVPGELALTRPPLDDAGLARVGRTVRAIHDGSPACRASDGPWETLLPVADPDLVCHNDLAPWNLVVGERCAFIDWDGAGPSTRLWDLAYAAQAFALNDPAQDPLLAATRLRAFVDAYGPDPATRAALPDAMGDRAAAMRDLLAASARTGREPWATMRRTGHGAHWAAATAYVRRHREVWAAVLGG